jgi:hypothetical protein
MTPAMQKIREALEFYATSWVNNSYGSADGNPGKRLIADKGQRATEALAILSTIEGEQNEAGEDVIRAWENLLAEISAHNFHAYIDDGVLDTLNKSLRSSAPPLKAGGR